MSYETVKILSGTGYGYGEGLGRRILLVGKNTGSPFFELIGNFTLNS